jgi:ABC-type polar amino acid transport system ATPase subunit
MDPLIRVDRIRKSYDSYVVLNDISLEIRQGEILAVIGPSGAGKSTFIRCLNGLEQVDSGSVFVHGRPVTSPADVAGRVGMVFQQFNLFPHYTAIDNIAAPLRTIKKMSRTRARERAAELLASVKLSDKADQYPSTLSGGQQQRLAIARALSMSPDIMLFDEPTSSLDPELAHEVFDTIQTLAERHMTLVLVTHQMNMVKHFATRVLFLENGGIFFDGTFENLTGAADPRIRQFLKKIYP